MLVDIRGAVHHATHREAAMKHGRIWMLVSLLSALALAVTGTIRPTAARAAATAITVVETFPINFVIPGCTEPIQLSGDLHTMFHITFDGNGGFHLVAENNPQGVTGIGLVTGTQYQGTGVGQFEVNGKIGSEVTAVSSFKIIGRGPTDNLLIQETLHTTVNANGEVTATVDNFFARCQG
jgi:hypothetical protein